MAHSSFNYSNNLSTHLDFIDLGSFLDNKERNLSQDFSHLILHIDQENSEINEQGMFLHLGYNDESDEYISRFSISIRDEKAPACLAAVVAIASELKLLFRYETN